LEGFTALNVAAEAGKYEIFEYLLSMGAAQKKGYSKVGFKVTSVPGPGRDFEV
jgi:hypothetical protein